MTVIGIDPGGTGAAVFIDMHSKERYVGVCRFKHGWRTFHDWLELLPTLEIPDVLLEDVHSITGDGLATSHQFGVNRGIVMGILIANGIYEPFDLVRPTTWQLEFGLGGKHGPPGCKPDVESRARKNAHKRKAIELFPEFDMTLDTCDAFLIAEYAWKKKYGRLRHGSKEVAQPRRAPSGIRWGSTKNKDLP